MSVVGAGGIKLCSVVLCSVVLCSVVLCSVVFCGLWVCGSVVRLSGRRAMNSCDIRVHVHKFDIFTVTTYSIRIAFLEACPFVSCAPFPQPQRV
jgi:hypothetical protein